MKLPVTIERFVDDRFPGWVECSLVDSDNCKHQFIEKAPVVTRSNLLPDTAFPQPGYIACVVVYQSIDARGRELVQVDTVKPWGVESAAGETRFMVLRSQIPDL